MSEVVKPPQQPVGPAGMRWGNLGMPTERSSDFGTTTGRLIKRLRRERLGVIAVIVLAFISVSLSVLGPRFLGHATDVLVGGLVSGRGVDFGRLHGILFQALGLFALGAALSYVLSYMLAGIVQRTMYRLRADVEDKLNRLPLSYVDRNERGDLLSRVTNDIDNVAQTLQQTLSQMLTSLLMLIGTLGMMFWISWVLSLVALVTIPVSVFTMKFIATRSRARFIAQWRHTGQLNAQVEEAFTGHSIVKAFGRAGEVEETFRRTNEELYEASFHAQFISGSIQPSMMVVGNLNFVAIAVLGGIRVASGAMSIGDVQAFIQYSRNFTMPLTHLASMANLFQSGIASAERVFEMLDAEEQEPDVSAGQLPVPRGRVEFDHVSFSYDKARPLITDLSLVAEPGKTIAIVGPTGAGKTTLVNLIMRFYEVDSGVIRIDGVDICSIPRHDLRSNIGMVLQDTWLFSGTIRDNIAYGNLEATEDKILEAARATYVDRFVHSLPDGYDTLIDDEGTSVSAGEKQLITIARAFLADPAILILDEATSSVDTRTEVLIQHAMAALRSQRTSFVIAHRLSTIRDADVILVVDGGRIVEQGNHADLLTRGGAYANLYNAQFSGAAAEVA
ncbi:MAG TPA: ABC transporter ATP-binding protein [Acidimicrobiales bacterium]|nr:ABC transporter ATP-binding protein [Acidimicrobiales bacterium]